LAVLSLVSSASAYVPPDNAQQKALWESFKTEFSKSYATMGEELNRFSNFVTNLKVAYERNSNERLAGGSAVHGTTFFSDLSQEEFSQRFLLTQPSSESSNITATSETFAPPSKTLALVDWTGKYTTAVKDQGYCGSCWAFSATEQIESDTIRTLGLTYKLSPAQITQCDKNGVNGCGGGNIPSAFNYVKSAGGIETEANYPYSSALYNGATGTCVANSAYYNTVTVSSYASVSGEANMGSYLQTKGPLAVTVDASTWNSYKSGIVTSCGTSINHAVQAVGVDTAAGGYWKVRNSWATSFGESGFIRLAYGKNTCGIASYAGYYVAVTKK